MRILVTGSRDWPCSVTVDDALVAVIQAEQARRATKTHPSHWVTIVHGDCPTGADAMADGFATHHGMDVERYPADWERHGKRAAYLRNQAMVDSNPDVCLAFIKERSRGASMTATFAERADIPTRRYLLGPS